MSGGARRGRFPGFDPLGQAPHWDQVTAELITARSEPPPEVKFFNDAETALRPNPA